MSDMITEVDDGSAPVKKQPLRKPIVVNPDKYVDKQASKDAAMSTVDVDEGSAPRKSGKHVPWD